MKQCVKRFIDKKKKREKENIKNYTEKDRRTTCFKTI